MCIYECMYVCMSQGGVHLHVVPGGQPILYVVFHKHMQYTWLTDMASEPKECIPI